MLKANELIHHEEIMRLLLGRCSNLLGGTAMPIDLDWCLLRLVQPRLRRLRITSLVSSRPVIGIGTGRPGHQVSAGLELSRLPVDHREIDVVMVTLPYQLEISGFWCVRAEDYRHFYRHVRKLYREDIRQTPPVLPPDQLQQLLDNTFHFLRRNPTVMHRLQIPVHRGVLLTGPPGNGKTMSCRWLRYECLRRGLEWKSVTRLEYEEAVREGTVPQLFSLSRQGVILFDDFDAALRDRSKYGDELQSTFLAELDGMTAKQGVVYLFTSNLKPEEIDAAARRPGRIDVILTFPAPSADLRHRLFKERWPREIIDGIPLDLLVEHTQGWSFAELEELRKMLAFRLIDGLAISWDEVQKQIRRHPRQTVVQRRMGFASTLSNRREPAPIGPAAKVQSDPADTQKLRR